MEEALSTKTQEFPLRMGKGVVVKDLGELREKYNELAVEGEYHLGRLERWLQDGGYGAQAQQVHALIPEDPYLPQRLKTVLFEDLPAAEGDAKQNEERVQRLSKVTSDETILMHPELVAFTQEELENLVNKRSPLIYLCGERFNIPDHAGNVTFIGVNRPLITLGPEGVLAPVSVDNVEVDWDTLLPPLHKEAQERVKRAFDGIEENSEVLTMYQEFWGPNQELAAKLVEDAALRTKQTELLNLTGELYLENEDEQEEAIRWFEETAAKEDPIGMFRYASCLINGYGIEQDIPKAMKLIEKAANAGYLVAINQMGMEYNTGRRVPANQKLAVKWYTEGAKRGHMSSIYNMAMFYDRGEGVRKNKKKSQELLQQVLDANYPPALDAQGRRYLAQEDPDRAVQMWRRAAEAGYLPAQATLGLCLLHGLRGVKMDGAEGVKWAEAAIAQGDVETLCVLGRAYMDGVAVEQDYDKARELFTEAAEAGDTMGQLFLVQCAVAQNEGGPNSLDDAMHEAMYKEDGTPRPAVKMIQDAFINALKDVANEGGLYASDEDWDDDDWDDDDWDDEDWDDEDWDDDDDWDEEEDTPQTFADAWRLLTGILREDARSDIRRHSRVKECKVEAEQGDSDAQFELACGYALGIGYAHSDASASRWFRKAAKQGIGAASYALGLGYRTGLGVVQNAEKEAEWFNSAKEAGYEAPFALWDAKAPNAQQTKPTRTVELMLACSKMLAEGNSAKRIGTQYNLTVKRVRELAAVLDGMNDDFRIQLRSALEHAQKDLEGDPDHQEAIEKKLERELWLLCTANELFEQEED